MIESTNNVTRLLGMTGTEYQDHARRQGRSSVGALAEFRAFHREGIVPPALAACIPSVTRRLTEESSEGDVIKFATSVAGGRADLPALEAESVLIPMIGSGGRKTYTLCVSSQIGCAMGCTFCETGQMGLIRSLEAWEIVAQWWNASHVIGIVPRNVVFMGMGEPLDNYENVVRAITVLKDHNGPHVAISRITVSTVGRVDGIRRLGEKVREPGWHRLGLALSLNAANDIDRSSIMPINRRWDLSQVRQALLDWPRRSGNKICVEYVLIPGVNDTRQHAEEIAEFLRPFGLIPGAHVAGAPLRAVLNLIPYNPRRNSPWPAPDEEKVNEFLAWLISLGVFAKRRRTKGRQLMGACGQLGSEHIRKRRLITPTIRCS
jgi:23S rRNA (adenine2503-C2)-methyltransferase